ncbi:hypothetical protein SLEP1_g44773 [Rubroshorea leprosula]|uniref:Uncharacterized protein n=1 Tax=Rubroshorea leprosula TaxID=152421 RepID=A0AAV5LIY4_9ROSI|nr:hypothetical protein SLEP1_g44773 [Rubroshorea leprosula]
MDEESLGFGHGLMHWWNIWGSRKCRSRILRKLKSWSMENDCEEGLGKAEGAWWL